MNLRILMLRYEGVKVKEIARLFGITVNTVSRICTQYREQGREEFMRMKYTSHCRLLSEEKEKEILDGFRNEVFKRSDDVIDRLCETIRQLSNEMVQSITARAWIKNRFLGLG